MKVVCLFLQGDSLKEFADPNKKFFSKESNCVFASINNFLPVNKILKEIDRKIEYLYCSSDKRYRDISDDIVKFIDEGGTLFTTSERFYAKKELQKYRHQGGDKQIILSDKGYGLNSLGSFLLTLGSMHFRDIFLFGADGGGSYYKNIYEDLKSVGRDTGFLNEFWPRLVEYAGESMSAGIPRMRITNVTPYIRGEPQTKLTCFDIMNIEDFYEQQRKNEFK